MWKYIITGAIVLFLAASFLFYKNFESMAEPATGEVAAVQSQFDAAVRKSKEIDLDKAIKQYAIIRKNFFVSETARFKHEQEVIEQEDAPLPGEIQRANDELAQAKKEYEDLKSEFEKFKNDLHTGVGLDEADEDSLRAVGQAIADLVNKNDRTEIEIARQLDIVANLGKASDRTLNLTRAAKKLNSDRLSRLSPPELRCQVVFADPKWDYVILDAGVDRGVVIGSRLQVMRGDRKICELDVTLVESNRSSCDVVYSTMRPGDRVQVGDIVYSVREDK